MADSFGNSFPSRSDYSLGYRRIFNERAWTDSSSDVYREEDNITRLRSRPFLPFLNSNWIPLPPLPPSPPSPLSKKWTEKSHFLRLTSRLSTISGRGERRETLQRVA